MAKPPTIDGTIDEAEWSGTPVLSGFTDTISRRPAADTTAVRIGYDAQFIYVAFDCRDSNPSAIVAREVTPGADFDNDDHVVFQINPFGSRSWSTLSGFQVNALGTQTEYLAGGRAAKREWRGEWKAAVKRLETGWSVEMAIPWRMIDTPDGEKRTMDINFRRFQMRGRVSSAWADLGLDERIERIGFWDAVNPPERGIGKPAEFLVYASPEVDENTASFRMGGDMRYRFSKQLTGVLTLFPDFKNIEDEIAGIEFTRTERFLEDNRPFFREGSDFFNLTGRFTFGRMFYSRRIEEVDVGGKVFGQLSDGVRIGALATVKHGEETAGVASIETPSNPRFGAKAYATGTSTFGQSATAFGANTWGRSGNWSGDAQIATESGGGTAPGSAYSTSVSYSVPHLFSVFRYSVVDPDFTPPLAFIPWTDRKGWYSYTESNREYRSGPLRSTSANLFFSDYNDFDGNSQEQSAQVGYSFSDWGDNNYGVSYSSSKYFGNSLDQGYSLSVGFNQSNRFRRFGFFINSGVTANDPSTYIGLNGTWRVLKRLDLGLNASLFEYQGTARQVILTAAYEMSPTAAFSGRVVSQDGKINAYLAYREAGGKGVEYYVILGDPNAVETRARIALKAVWAF